MGAEAEPVDWEIWDMLKGMVKHETVPIDWAVWELMGAGIKELGGLQKVSQQAFSQNGKQDCTEFANNKRNHKLPAGIRSSLRGVLRAKLVSSNPKCRSKKIVTKPRN